MVSKGVQSPPLFARNSRIATVNERGWNGPVGLIINSRPRIATVCHPRSRRPRGPEGSSFVVLAERLHYILRDGGL